MAIVSWHLSGPVYSIFLLLFLLFPFLRSVFFIKYNHYPAWLFSTYQHLPLYCQQGFGFSCCPPGITTVITHCSLFQQQWKCSVRVIVLSLLWAARQEIIDSTGTEIRQLSFLYILYKQIFQELRLPSLNRIAFSAQYVSSTSVIPHVRINNYLRHKVLTRRETTISLLHMLQP